MQFDELIAPVASERFFEAFWETKPLHVARGDAAFYDPLISAEQVAASIASGGLRHPAIQLAKDGGFLPAEAFTHNLRSGNDVFTGVPDWALLESHYADGA